MKVLWLHLAKGWSGIVDPNTDGPPPVIDGKHQCLFFRGEPARDFNGSSSTGPWGGNLVVSTRARRLIERAAPGARFAEIATDQGVYWGILELPFQEIDEDASRMTRLIFRPEELGTLGVFNVRFEGEVTGPYATEAFATECRGEGLSGVGFSVIWDSERTVWRPEPYEHASAVGVDVATSGSAEDSGAGAVVSAVEFVPVDPDDRVMLDDVTPSGYALLGVGPSVDAVVVAEAAEAMLRDLRHRADGPGTGHDVVAVGAAVGDAIVRDAGWRWMNVREDGGDASLCVVAPDVSRYLEVIAWCDGFVEDGREGEVTGMVAGVVGGLRLPGRPGAPERLG